MRELMYQAEYNDGICSYLVEKESDEGTVSIIVYDTFKERKKEIRRI